MQNIKSIIFGFIALTVSSSIQAQSSANSPYTRYGYGILADGSFGPARAMGGTSLGFRQNNRINSANPASYSAIDSTTFLFDFGLSGQIGKFAEGNARETKQNGGIDYLAIQFPLWKNVGASIGLVPFSTVGYQFGDSLALNTTSGTKTYSGEGGFSQVYGGIAWAPFKNLSVGANFNYLFGSISHEKATTLGTGVYSGSETIRLRSRALKTDFGVQYFTTGKEKNFCIGATYSPKTKISATVDTIKIQSNSSSTTAKTTGIDFDIADSYGLGAAIQLNNNWTIASDALYQNWSKANYYSKKDTLNDRFRISGGVEYIPNSNGRKYYERIKYRLGAHVSNNYLNIRNQSLGEYGVSLGLGLPFKTSRSVLNLGVEYTKINPQNSLMIKESYLKFSVNITFNEFWFFKRKID